MTKTVITNTDQTSIAPRVTRQAQAKRKLRQQKEKVLEQQKIASERRQELKADAQRLNQAEDRDTLQHFVNCIGKNEEGQQCKYLVVTDIK